MVVKKDLWVIATAIQVHVVRLQKARNIAGVHNHLFSLIPFSNRLTMKKTLYTMLAFIIIFSHLFPKQTDHKEGTSYNITRWNIFGSYNNLCSLISFTNKLTLHILLAWNILSFAIVFSHWLPFQTAWP